MRKASIKKRRFKKSGAKAALIVLAALVVTMMTPAAASAESYEFNGTSTFNGKDIVSDFDNREIADRVSELQPGDEATFTIRYVNGYDGPTDWYMANEVLQTLEKADAARKVPGGTGTPERGGYTYELIHLDNSGKEQTLFSNTQVGGDAKPAEMEGLEQATNALNDWFYIQRLNKKGDHGTVILHVAFEGETEVNDYMDTDGGLLVRFAVELPKEGSEPGTPGALPKDKPGYVQTGDDTDLRIWILTAAGSLVLLLLGLLSRRRDRRQEESAGGDSK